MVIDDKELEIKQRACVNGVTVTLYHCSRLGAAFVYKDSDIVAVKEGSMAISMATYEYDRIVKSCLAQVYDLSIVEGTLTAIS